MSVLWLWGEIPPPRENKLRLSSAEREALCSIPRALNLEGPKIHQPTERTLVKREPPPSDPLVTNTIQLLAYKQQLDRLMDIAIQYKQAVSAGELDQMPHLSSPPPMPEIVEFKRSSEGAKSPFGYSFKDETPFTRGESAATPVANIGPSAARQSLYRSVATLVAHTGYHTANSIAMEVLTDAVGQYLQTLCRKLREAVDRELEAAPDAATGFPDTVERVMRELGLETVLVLQDYYEDGVVRYHDGVVAACQEVTEKYKEELPEWNNGSVVGGQFSDHDDIPEMHFPSSEEQDGEGGLMLDHATPQLDAGMQMLQSLEASGELGGVDTPMSMESEGMGGSVLSMSVATPSPQVGGRVTPSGRTSSPQLPMLGSGRKRRRSGKFL